MNAGKSGFREFTASFDNLLNAGKKYHKKMRTVSGTWSGESWTKLEDHRQRRKNMALYVSTVYDLGLMLMDDAVLQQEKTGACRDRLPEDASLYDRRTAEQFRILPGGQQAILHHHEKYDGSGYPDGLEGRQNPPHLPCYCRRGRLLRDDFQKTAPEKINRTVDALQRDSETVPARAMIRRLWRRWRSEQLNRGQRQETAC